MGKESGGKIHAMLIEYEKGLPKKAETSQVMMIRDGKIQKANKKSLKAKGKNKVNGKGNDKKDWPEYLAELQKKRKKVGSAVLQDRLEAETRSSLIVQTRQCSSSQSMLNSFEKRLIKSRNQWGGVDLEEIQEEEGYKPSVITRTSSRGEGFEPPQKDVI
ncbi:hypothetical protein Tco_1067147 [Tanacetum coccineum]|uniref:Uncharacterized protein n=1 Tax=Tanacetum coccineum TaxID=301880 RepID=A0ABQ5HC11_9ASTR